MKIIDAHTHFFPKFVSQSPVQWARGANEPYWARLVGPRPDGKLSLQGFPDEKKFLSDMDSAGVEHAIIQGWYWQKHETCVSINAEISRIVAAHPDRLSAFASVQPNDSRAVEIAERAREMGFCGLGEIHDGVQNFSYLSKNFEFLAEAATASKLPICIHITESSKKNYPGKTDTRTGDALSMARKFPRLRLILAHWCGNLALSKDFSMPQNAYIDSAASPLIAPPEAWKLGVSNFPERAIYASDYPIRLYPRKFKVEEMETIINESKSSVPDPYAKNFFFENIKKLCSIKI